MNDEKPPNSHEIAMMWGFVIGLIFGSIIMIVFMSSQFALCTA